MPQDGPEPERPQPRRAAADDPEIAEADREIERLTQVLVELEALQERQRRVVVLRRRLRVYRRRLQSSRRALTAARRRWFDGLHQLGIGSNELQSADALVRQRAAGGSVSGGSSKKAAGPRQGGAAALAPRLRNAVAVIERLGRAAEMAAALRRMERELERKQRRVEKFGQRVGAVAARLGATWEEGADPCVIVRQWAARLEDMPGGVAEERRRQWQEVREQRATLRRARRRLRKQAARLRARWGARSRAEFQNRIEQARQHEELHEELQLIRQELQNLVEQYGDIAVTEDDLRTLDPEQNSEQLRIVEAELRDTEGDIARLRAECEALETQTADYRGDLRGARMRFEREAAWRRFRDALHDWIAAAVARESLLAAKATIERRCQPSVLRDAGALLRRLTADRYSVLWMPLGENRLMVDTASGTTLPCAQLSDSTRVLLQLALRLAACRAWAGGDAGVPVVLDGVCEALDRRRMQSVAEALRTLLQSADDAEAATGPGKLSQVVILSCRRSVAEVLSERGAACVELPEPSWHASELRRAG
ncbi:MAG: hypothetical protein D6725_13275 [Planctomycetota bacterium]|nr:MAG: hypothetical protein D6725_13275 [Planctomycetota bacterium]